MEWVSAPNIEDGPLEPARRRFSFAGSARRLQAVEEFLEVERAQLPLWLVASFGGDCRLAVAASGFAMGGVHYRNPRWLKLDRQALSQSGGMALYLGKTPHIETVSDRLGSHPWRQAALYPAVRANSRLMVAPHREFIAAGVDEVKAAPAGE